MKRIIILLGLSLLLNSCYMWRALHGEDRCNPDKQFKGRDKSATDIRNHS